MNFFVKAALNLFISYLQSTIKNKRSVAKEAKILWEAKEYLDQVITLNNIPKPEDSTADVLD